MVDRAGGSGAWHGSMESHGREKDEKEHYNIVTIVLELAIGD